MKRTLLAGGIALGALLSGAPAQANIVFTLGNNPQPDEANILFGSSETGSSIVGFVGGAAVTFSSLTGQTLTQVAKGQAKIECASGCVDNSPPPGTASQLNSIEMKAGLSAEGNPTGWHDAIINLDFGVGWALVTVTDQLGGSFTYKLGNGQNYLTMVAVDNQLITDIKVIEDPAHPGDFGWNQFKQPRVSGLCELTGPGTCEPIIVPTPEPLSAALLGVGLLGIGAVRRKWS